MCMQSLSPSIITKQIAISRMLYLECNSTNLRSSVSSGTSAMTKQFFLPVLSPGSLPVQDHLTSIALLTLSTLWPEKPQQCPSSLLPSVNRPCLRCTSTDCILMYITEILSWRKIQLSLWINYWCFALFHFTSFLDCSYIFTTVWSVLKIFQDLYITYPL